MTDSPADPRRMRAVGADQVPAALADALAGGDPVAPLPEAGTERRTMLDLLQPDVLVVEPDAAAVVVTSGSTGRPKGVVLSRSAIAASATATHRRLGGPGDWVLALPPQHVAGLMVLARCAVAGTTAHRVDPHLVGLSGVASRMIGRRYLSLVPTQLVWACRDEELTATLAGFDAVLVGGAAADPELLARAAGLGIPVVTSYGMSETCGGCVYDGVPLDGVTVELEPGTQRILLGGPTLFSGYRLQPGLTAAARSGGRFRTSDRGRWERDRLTVLGRLDEVVISGGINVDLAAVERAAGSWPALDGAEIAVVAVPDPEWGVLVIAVTDGAGALADLRRHLGGRLPAAAAPRRLVELDVLPRTSSGKIDRQRLIADLAALVSDR